VALIVIRGGGEFVCVLRPAGRGVQTTSEQIRRDEDLGAVRR